MIYSNAINIFGLRLDSEHVLFGLFSIIVIVFLVADLGFFNDKARKVSTRNAFLQTIFWIIISLAFSSLIFIYDSHGNAYDYLSAYLTEKALSIDNIFVMLLILTHFKISQKYFHKILFWGILGAIIMRGIFITLGAALVKQYDWILYIFGVILLYTGIKMLLSKDEEEMNPEKGIFFRFIKKNFKMLNTEADGKLWVRKRGKLFFTKIFMVIILIESTDLIFAVDSIPAVFSISQNEFVIYTSNIFAVFGLRAMFFLLSGIIEQFHYLQTGLSFLLMFIGAKMLLHMVEVFVPSFHLEISSITSLIIIISVLGISVLASLIFPKEPKPVKESPVDEK